MLRTLHHHISAVRIQSLLSTSPLVLVYQALGEVNAGMVREVLSGNAKHSTSNEGYMPEAFKIRNCVPSGALDERFANCFQSSSMVVGWQQHTLAQQHPLPSVTRTDRFQNIFGTLSQQTLPQVPQTSLARMLKGGIALQTHLPVVLVGCFYRHDPVPLGHLQQWIKLKEPDTYVDLLQAIQCAQDHLASSLTPYSSLPGIISAQPSAELLHCLDSLHSNQSAK